MRICGRCILKVLTMVYNTQNHWVSGLRKSSGILELEEGLLEKSELAQYAHEEGHRVG
jgi:hypothetical protein